MKGVLINMILVTIGTAAGLLVKNSLNERLSNAMFTGMGLCVLYLGISGSLDIIHPLYAIISMAIGGLIGEWIDLDKYFYILGDKMNQLFKNKNEKIDLSAGFINASLLFCSGGMTIYGAISGSLSGDYTILISKSIIDMIAAAILSAKHGIGVLLSTLFILVYEGAFVLFADVLKPLAENADVMADFTGVGSLILIGMGLNMLNLTKIKTMNYLPAMVLMVVLSLMI